MDHMLILVSTLIGVERRLVNWLVQLIQLILDFLASPFNLHKQRNVPFVKNPALNKHLDKFGYLAQHYHSVVDKKD